MKMFHSAKHFQENFLRGVGGVSWICDHAINQAVDGLMKFSDEPGVGLFRSGLQFRHDGGFLGSNS